MAITHPLIGRLAARLERLQPLAADAVRALRAVSNPHPLRVLCAVAIILGHDREAEVLMRRLRSEG